MKRKFQKILSLCLTVMMLVGFIPVGIVNVTADENDSLILGKTVKLENDGTYTIDLSAYSTGTSTTTTVKTGVPLDIVLVLDQSGSMKEEVGDLRTAVTSFVNKISDNAREYNVDHKIALVGYASDNDDGKSDSGTISSGSSSNSWINTGVFINGTLKNYGSFSNSTSTQLVAQDYKDALVSVNTNDVLTTSITTAISKIASSGATRTSYGMLMAQNVFANNPIEEGSNRKRLVVLFTDGEPGYRGFEADEANPALDSANVLKTTYNATIYSVGLYSNPSNETVNFMNYISSNYQNVTSMPSTGTTYTYTPVYNVDTNQTYYRYNNNGYSQVYYCDGGWFGVRAHDPGWYTEEHGWNHGGTTLNPKTSENSTGTQFYTRTVTETPTPVANKYYMTTNNSSQLDNIFTNISQDIIDSSSNVTLDETSVMRDILADGFTLPEGYNSDSSISVSTQVGSADSSGNITWAEEVTKNPENVVATADPEKGVIDITGFDYSGEYIAESHSGKKLMVTIKGIVATDEAITDGAVYTNNENSGVYKFVDKVPVVKFSRPTVNLASKLYVLDFGKAVDFTGEDFSQASITHLDADGMNKFDDSVTEINKTYGNAAIDADKTAVTYQPNKLIWDDFDHFYAFGKQTTGDDALNIWSKISVVPATNVYFEDDFVEVDVNEEGTATTAPAIEYSKNWETVGRSQTDKQSSVNENYGYDASYNGDLTWSNGSAHKVVATDNTSSTATFTFKGTGVDIYSKTDLETGVISVTVYEGTKVDESKIVDVAYCDNLYEPSGKYDADGLYQIPTVSFDLKEYGTYTVKILVYNGETTSSNSADRRKTYYLDGIRVYNPVSAGNTNAQIAYDNAKEHNPQSVEVRDYLISANSFTAGQNVTGAVFIDLLNDNTIDIGTYKNYGPKNEVYLQPGQAVAFKVDAVYTGKAMIGLKAVNGSTTAEVSNGDSVNIYTINSANDMYYEVTPKTDANNAKYIIIKNPEGNSNLLSITKLRLTNTAASVTASLSVDDGLMNYVDTFSSLKSEDAKTEENILQQAGTVTIDVPENDTLISTETDTETVLWKSIESSAKSYLQ